MLNKVANDFLTFQDYCLPDDSFYDNLSGIVDLVTASMKPAEQSSGSVNQSVVPVRSVPEQSAGLAGGLEQTVRKNASNGKADSRKWIRNQNKRKDWETRDIAVHLGMMRESSRSVHFVCWDQLGSVKILP